MMIDMGDAVEDEGKKKESTIPQSSLPAIMRRFALFIDGMTRAMILPFGPTLVHRLVYGSSEILSSTWSGVGYYLGWVVAVYIFGRWLGGTLASRWTRKMPRERLPINIARFGGAALSLHIFTYGAGLASVGWLLAIRLLSAILAGLLCGITSAISLPEDDWVYRKGCLSSLEEERQDALRRREGYVDIASGTAKIYLTGFAVSILSGGLLFRTATKDATFQALTGAYQFSLSPLFLVGVAVTAEIVLRGLFALARNPFVPENEDSGTAGRVRGVVRRMVSDISQNKSRDVVIAVETLPLAGRRDLAATTTFSPFLERDVHDDDRSAQTSQKSVYTVGHQYFDADDRTHRSRVESYSSIDEFFDCRSVGTNAEPTAPFLFDTNKSDEIAAYVDGKCMYLDGSPAYVPPGNCTAVVPQNYLDIHNQNKERAMKAWQATQKWRLENRVWKIHTIPDTEWVWKIKEAYPHFIHGHSKAGFPIIYEQPGKMDLKSLFKSGCDVKEMLQHFTFMMEYLSHRVCMSDEIRSLKQPDEEGNSWGTMVVMDAQGAGLTMMSSDVVKYLVQAGQLNSNHYPMILKRATIINAPFWLAGAWSGMKGIIPESVQLDFCSESRYPAGLREYIDEDQIPPEYGGTSPYALGSHPYEVELQNLVNAVKDNEDTDEITDLPPTAIAVSGSPPKTNERGLNMPISHAPILSPIGVVNAKRRRNNSADREQIRNFKGSDLLKSTSKAGVSFSSQRDVFLIVSGMHILWSFVQGGIEVAIPLWTLSPAVMGGLGYSPSRAGVSLFCSCLVLLWSLRRKSSRMVSKIPSKSPLRAFRIGAGSESALLVLLTLVSISSDPLKRSDSVVVMTSTIILFACMALATMVGRSASKILHRIAAESFARQPKPLAQAKNSYIMVELFSECETGKFTAALNLAAEVVGIFVIAPLWSISISSEKAAPFDATCILCVSSLITFVLYVCSFALHLNHAGEFAPHPKDSYCTDSRWRRCVPFICEVIAVSAGDMASLFDEANWNSTPLLGLERTRTFSDTSAISFADMMERGEESSSGRKGL